MSNNCCKTYKGEQGPQGLSGPRGLKGCRGAPGKDGEIGPRGPQGPRGYNGCPGPTGPRGLEGPQGPQGEPGCRGVRGFKGCQGERGECGETGPKGDTGERGPRGYHGPHGCRGPEGPTGCMGPEGPQGPKGWPGPRGCRGPEGCTGPRGKDGCTGPRGPMGIQGPAGPAGGVSSIVVEVSDTQTGPSSNSVTLQDEATIRFWSNTLDITVQEGSALVNNETRDTVDPCDDPTDQVDPTDDNTMSSATGCTEIVGSLPTDSAPAIGTFISSSKTINCHLVGVETSQSGNTTKIITFQNGNDKLRFVDVANNQYIWSVTAKWMVIGLASPGAIQSHETKFGIHSTSNGLTVSYEDPSNAVGSDVFNVSDGLIEQVSALITPQSLIVDNIELDNGDVTFNFTTSFFFENGSPLLIGNMDLTVLEMVLSVDSESGPGHLSFDGFGDTGDPNDDEDLVIDPIDDGGQDGDDEDGEGLDPVDIDDGGLVIIQD